MNRDHQCACAGPEWRAVVREHIIPWTLSGVDLGDEVLELGPGYGATTEVLVEMVPALTCVEIDPTLAVPLAERFGDTVDIVEGDATSLAFDDGRFSGVVSFSMLHHVPSVELQDRLFAEACRVLRPGGVLAATDSLETDDLRGFHKGDIFVPVDADTVGARLERAGFADVTVERNDFAWKAVARRTA